MFELKRPLKVFLCHAHADRDPVRGLYARLTQDGVDAWLDKEKLLPGQDWELEIRKAVREADVVVVCLSKQFNQAGFRQKEVRLALDTAMEKPEGEIFIIPARLEECDNLESLRRWHLVDLFEDGGHERLMHALDLRSVNIGILPAKQGLVNHKIKPESAESVFGNQQKLISSTTDKFFAAPPLDNIQKRSNSFWNVVQSFGHAKIAVDLGSTRTRVGISKKGIVVDECSLVIRDKRFQTPVLIGDKAKDMISNTDMLSELTYPIRNGVINDLNSTESMLKYFLESAQRHLSSFLKPNIVVCNLFSGATTVERRATSEAILGLDIKKVYFVDNLILASLGIGLPIDGLQSNMIVSMGGTLTEVGVIKNGRIIFHKSIRHGGENATKAVITYCRDKFGVLIDDSVAELSKVRFLLKQTPDYVDTYGKNISTGKPQSIRIPLREIKKIAFEEVWNELIKLVKSCVEVLDPKSILELANSGVYLVGGGSLLDYFAEDLKNEFSLPFRRAREPDKCIVQGAMIVSEKLEKFQRLFVTEDW